MIYLDNAATTKVASEVFEAMRPYLEDEYGNPGSTHKAGISARDAVIQARSQVAGVFGCDPHRIVFTSGGAEGNSSVFAGVRRYLLDRGRAHIIISATEHDSVRRSAEALIADGFTVSEVGVYENGVVSTDELKRLITKETGLVSVMYVNNEVGSVNPIREIGEMLADTPILFHTDCVQAAGMFEIDVSEMQCDYATISSHKIHGPKGVGALYIKADAPFAPLINGGEEQEFGLRGGTENVPGIVGFGKACEMVEKSLGIDTIAVSVMKQSFFEVLTDDLFGIKECIGVNANSVMAPGKVLNLKINGVDAQTLVLYLAGMGVCISAGSACRSHESEPSKTLLAIGLTPDEARSSVRFSFSGRMDARDVVKAAELTAASIKDMREV